MQTKYLCVWPPSLAVSVSDYGTGELSHVASIKFNILRTFPEELNHLSLILINIWRFQATYVTRFGKRRQKERKTKYDVRVLVSSSMLVIVDSVLTSNKYDVFTCTLTYFDPHLN